MCSYQRHRYTEISCVPRRTGYRSNSISATRSHAHARISGMGLLRSKLHHREHRFDSTVSREITLPRVLVSAVPVYWNRIHAIESTGSNERYLEKSVDLTCSYQRLHTSTFHDVPLRALNQQKKTCNPYSFHYGVITTNSFRSIPTACA
jgi:hypothetical protein